MSKFIKMFYVNCKLESPKQIINWWESKRIAFNIFNTLSLIIGLLLVYLSIPSLINFFLFPFIISYGIVINIIYILGWITLVIVREAWKERDITIIASMLFIIFFVFSIFSTLSICVIYLLLNIP